MEERCWTTLLLAGLALSCFVVFFWESGERSGVDWVSESVEAFFRFLAVLCISPSVRMSCALILQSLSAERNTTLFSGFIATNPKCVCLYAAARGKRMDER